MRVLAISAHPDDETLGCGGTLLRHRAEGDTLGWLIATRVRGPRWSAEIAEAKETEIRVVAEAYGMGDVLRLDHPATGLADVAQAELMEEIRDSVRAFKPSVVYTVHGGDVHSDHRALHAAVTAVLKSFHMRDLGVSRVLTFETLSSTDAAPQEAATAFLPQIYRDITPYLEQKIAVARLYATEMQPEPKPRTESAVRALARYRGSTVGVPYAEAFSLLREVS
jgi:N-acetylglucosamine malate deacetylase 1